MDELRKSFKGGWGWFFGAIFAKLVLVLMMLAGSVVACVGELLVMLVLVFELEQGELILQCDAGSLVGMVGEQTRAAQEVGGGGRACHGGGSRV